MIAGPYLELVPDNPCGNPYEEENQDEKRVAEEEEYPERREGKGYRRGRRRGKEEGESRKRVEGRKCQFQCQFSVNKC